MIVRIENFGANTSMVSEKKEESVPIDFRGATPLFFPVTTNISTELVVAAFRHYSP